MLQWWRDMQSGLVDLREQVVLLKQEVEAFRQERSSESDAVKCSLASLSETQAQLSSLCEPIQAAISELDQAKTKYEDAADLARGAVRTAQEMVRQRGKATEDVWAAR